MYQVLKKSSYGISEFQIIPLRFLDRYKIMQWRNDQMYHLRQRVPLTREMQDEYFNKVVMPLFEQDKPEQILFSYLQGNECIGYGGLVHINWYDKNAEISFIMDTQLEEEYFDLHWGVFLELLEKVAFTDLKLHKIFTYAFDVRPHLFPAIERKGYQKEAILREHYQLDDRFMDVKIHSKFKSYPTLRNAYFFDSSKAFIWVNNEAVRRYAINKDIVSLENHQKWFENKLCLENCEYYFLEVGTNAVGSVRFDVNETECALVSFLLDPEYFGRGLGSLLLKEGLDRLKHYRREVKIVNGDVHEENIASLHIFRKLGFEKIGSKGVFSRYQLKL